MRRRQPGDCAVAVMTLMLALAAVGEPPFEMTPPAQIPQPMPAAEKFADFWQQLRGLWQQQLGTVVPSGNKL